MLEGLAAELRAAGCPRVLVMPADLSRRGEADRLGRAAVEALGGVDLLVNNAAWHLLQRLTDVDDDVARGVYETNVWSPLALVKAVLPALQASERGAIVNVCSAAAYMAPPMSGTYASSKAAAVALTDILRLELRDTGVSVLEVVPGPVETAMLETSRQAAFVDLVLRVLRPGTPDGMAECLVKGVERNRRRVSYPWHTRASVLFPGIGKWFMRTVATKAEI
jgi:uncharacterized protein